MAHADATDHPLAKEILIDIANEEREHVGEFNRLLEILTGDEAEWLEEGREEVEEMSAELEAAGTESAPEVSEEDEPRASYQYFSTDKQVQAFPRAQLREHIAQLIKGFSA